MHRRELLRGGMALPVLAALGATQADAAAADARHAVRSAPRCANLAHQLAQKPYQPPDSKLPDELKNLTISSTARSASIPRKALWRGQGTKFTAEFFHRGFLYKDRVDIYQVVNGRALPIHVQPGPVHFRQSEAAARQPTWAIAGFRLHYPLNRADYYDEVCAFLGASYFRALAKGQGYGMSARGLAIKTADPPARNSRCSSSSGWRSRRPASIRWWCTRCWTAPAPPAPSASRCGRARTPSWMPSWRCIPRVDIDKSGLAPLTSMFFFDVNDRVGVDDYRRGGARFRRAAAAHRARRTYLAPADQSARSCRSAPSPTSARAASA